MKFTLIQSKKKQHTIEDIGIMPKSIQEVIEKKNEKVGSISKVSICCVDAYLKKYLYLTTTIHSLLFPLVTKNKV